MGPRQLLAFGVFEPFEERDNLLFLTIETLRVDGDGNDEISLVFYPGCVDVDIDLRAAETRRSLEFLDSRRLTQHGHALVIHLAPDADALVLRFELLEDFTLGQLRNRIECLRCDLHLWTGECDEHGGSFRSEWTEIDLPFVLGELVRYFDLPGLTGCAKISSDDLFGHRGFFVAGLRIA